MMALRWPCRASALLSMRLLAVVVALLLCQLGEAAEGRSLSQLMKSLRELEQAGAVQQGEIDSVLDAGDPKAAAHALLEQAASAGEPSPPPPSPPVAHAAKKTAKVKRKKSGGGLSKFNPGPPGPQRDLFMSLWMAPTAGQRGDPSAVRQALADGAKTEFIAPGSRGQTPLMMAVVMSGNPELMSPLIDAGADLTTTEESGFTLLDAAAFQGRKEAVATLLDAGADPLRLSSDGWGAAHRAAAGVAPRYAEIVELFLQHGVSPNLVDNAGLPMVLHARTAQTRQVLLDAGACIPGWFTKDDVAASCREDENCPSVPQMAGNPDVFSSAGSCDKRLGEVVPQVPRHLASQSLGDMCPCQCGRWITPPVCDAEVLGGKTEADGRPAWESLHENIRHGPLPIPPEGLAEAIGKSGMQMPKEVKMDLR